jgi:hypothetical protein
MRLSLAAHLGRWYTRFMPWIAVGLLVLTSWLLSHTSEHYIFDQYLGADGHIHYEMARADEAYFQGHHFVPHSMSRMLLPRLAHYTAELFRHLGWTQGQGELDTYLGVFGLLNALGLAFILWVFVRLATHYQLGNYRTLCGLVLLAVNYSFLRIHAFNPFLTDLWAGAMVSLAVYAAVKQWPRSLQYGLFFLVCLSHPLAFLVVVPFLLFPARTPLRSQEDPRLRHLLTWLYRLGIGGFLLLLGLYWAYYLYAWWHPDKTPPLWGLPLDLYLLPLSLALYLLYIRYLHRRLVPAVLSQLAHYPFSRGTALSLLIILLLVVLRYVLIYSLAQPTGIDLVASKGGYTWFLLGLFYHTPMQFPAITLVADLLYFGLFILLVLLHRGPLIRALTRQGLAFSLFALMFALFMVDSESRHITYSYPIAVLFLAMVLPIRRGRAWAFGLLLLGLNALLAGIWLPVGGWPADPISFWQNFEGPWMNPDFYYYSAVLTVLVFVLLWWQNRK